MLPIDHFTHHYALTEGTLAAAADPEGAPKLCLGNLPAMKIIMLRDSGRARAEEAETTRYARLPV